MKIRPGQKPTRAVLWSGVCTLAISSMLVGCTVLAPRPDPSRFFVLSPLGAAAQPGASQAASLGVGPIRFPHYLDRPEVVTRVGPNEVRPAEFDYWAGSLSRQFETVLAENLQTLVGAERVQIYPWYAKAAPDLAVEVEVIRFEASSNDRVELAARWRIRKGSQLEALRTGESALSGAAGAGGPGAAAEALSGLLGDFSRELAQAILAARA
jgi:uncharacterized protein